MLRSERVTSGDRIHALDFAKGALVLLMVVYHALNYLGYESIPHDYLRFVPSSFIMITGFLVWQVYGPRRHTGFPAVASRLALRAFKLIALFTVLNVAARLVWSRDRYGTELDISSFFDRFASVYLAAAPEGVAFEVLLPISYTLLLSIVLLLIPPSRGQALRALAIAVFALCTVLGWAGKLPNSLSFIGAGVIGVALGSFSQQSVDLYARSLRLQALILGSCIVALLFGLDNYPIQILATLLSLMVLYAIGSSLDVGRSYYQQVCLLGRYSLLSYVIQILYLQGTDWLLALGPRSAVGSALFLTVAVTLMMWLTVIVVEMTRPRIKVIDRVYRMLFA